MPLVRLCPNKALEGASWTTEPKERRSGNTTLSNRFDESSEEQRAFDVSAVPNILDDPSNPAEEPSRPKKVKGVKVHVEIFLRLKKHREFPLSRVDLVWKATRENEFPLN
ncbi:hypothetical protein JOM56_010189 [Amanita muscaria]